MNLKKTLFGTLAGVALAASLAAPVAMAQPAENTTTNNSTNAVVTVVTNGEFDVYFNTASFNLSGVTLNASNPEDSATGQMRVYYLDTLADRPNFDVNVSATDFDNINSANAAHIIDAEGFEITYAYNVQQGQWDAVQPQGLDVGDIGYFVDGAYVTQTTGGQAWTGTTNLSGAGITAQFGYAGVGTIGSYGDLDVEVEVPHTTTAGQYESTVTLTVLMGTRP